MATAPKSNASYMGLEKAMSAVQNTKISGIPVHLMDAHYKGAAKLGHGDGYKYAHDYENHYVNQQYLPDELVNEVFYNPGDLGYEVKVKEHFKKIKGQHQSDQKGDKLKALIEKLAIGNVDYEVPKAQISHNSFDMVLAKGEIAYGSFNIRSESNMNIKGVVYSSDYHLKLKK